MVHGGITADGWCFARGCYNVLPCQNTPCSMYQYQYCYCLQYQCQYCYYLQYQYCMVLLLVLFIALVLPEAAPCHNMQKHTICRTCKVKQDNYITTFMCQKMGRSHCCKWKLTDDSSEADMPIYIYHRDSKCKNQGFQQ